MKRGNTRVHSAEDSPGAVNFNPAAVAANKNRLINRDVRESRSASPTPLPLD